MITKYLPSVLVYKSILFIGRTFIYGHEIYWITFLNQASIYLIFLPQVKF